MLDWHSCQIYYPFEINKKILHFHLQNGILTAIWWHIKVSVIAISWAETVVYVKKIMTSHRRFERY